LFAEGVLDIELVVEDVLDIELVVEDVLDVELVVETVENVLLIPVPGLITVGVAVFDGPVMPIIVWTTPAPTENVPLLSEQLHFPDA